MLINAIFYKYISKNYGLVKTASNTAGVSWLLTCVLKHKF